MDCTLFRNSKKKSSRVHLIVLVGAIVLCYYAVFESNFWSIKTYVAVFNRFKTSLNNSFIGWLDSHAPIKTNFTDSHIINAFLANKSHIPLSTKAPKKIVYSDKSKFSVSLNMEDAVLLKQMLQVFDAAMKSVNVSYFIIGGILLGSYRNHGQIPWDDDADVIFNNSDASTVKQVLSKFDPRFQLHVPRPFKQFPCMKYYPTNGHQVNGGSYRTPYIDLFQYNENDTHLLNTSPIFSYDVYAKRHVFPLVQRPFGELSLPAPCNSRAIMEAYGVDLSVCRRGPWNHIGEHVSSPAEIPCTLLTEMYPFVHRDTPTNVTDGKVVETLVLGKLVLRQVSIEGVC